MATITARTNTVLVDYTGDEAPIWQKRSWAKAAMQSLEYTEGAVVVTFISGERIEFAYQTFGAQFDSNAELFDFLDAASEA